MKRSFHSCSLPETSRSNGGQDCGRTSISGVFEHVAVRTQGRHTLGLSLYLTRAESLEDSTAYNVIGPLAMPSG